MKKILLFRTASLFIASCISLLALAQNFTLRGSITEKGNSPVPDASIILVGTNKATTSDADGNFRFSGIASGDYTLRVAALGFGPKEQRLTVSGDTRADLQMDAGAIDLKEVRVSSGNDRTTTSMISAIDRDLRPVQTAQDLLKMVPGLFIAQHAGGGKAEQIFIRGFDSDHGTDLYVTVDGTPVNMVSHAHGQGYADLHFVIPETVERIHVFKGPYTTRFGDFSTAGTVEMDTRDQLENSEVKVEGGMFNTFRGLAMIDLLGKDKHIFSKRPENLYVAGEFVHTDAYFDAKQDFNRSNIFLKYSGLLSDRTHLAVSASTFGANWNASGQVPQRAVDEGIIDRFGAIDSDEGGNTSRTNVNATLVTRLRNEASWKNELYYVKYDFSLFSNFTFFLEDPVHGDMINQRDHRDIVGYNGSYTQHALIGDKPLRWTAGAAVRADQSYIQLLHAQERVITDTVRSGHLDQINPSAYMAATLDLSKRWSINAGLRYDVYDFNYTEDRYDSLSGNKVVSRTSPKLNLYYQAKENVQLYLRTGIGFHSNDARSVVISGSENNLPAAYGVDLGSTFKVAPRVLVNAALWGLYLESEIVYVGDGGTTEINTPTQRLGADLGVRYQISDKLFADLDVNYAHGRVLDVPSSENRIPLAPEITTIGGISYKQDKGWNGTLRYRYIGDRPANADNSVVAQGYFLVDAGASYRFTKLEVGISVENLLNTEWNQAQFDTESRLFNEAAPVSELHFTPGTPFFLKGVVSYRF
ncbi:MAG: TonB-dependent receptor [Flavobacteriales bacterium]|jgi:outer membrane receptor protein involved in Fe transport|nr:TonB-dependent receptor [Flavobacteriales bacterium]